MTKRRKERATIAGLRQELQDSRLTLERVRARAEQAEAISMQCAERMLAGNAAMWTAYLEQLGLALRVPVRASLLKTELGRQLFLSHCAEIGRRQAKR